MINVDNKVKNIYYMLCYSFYGEKLNEKDEATLGSEAFDNVYDLFSLLLYLILSKQIKKGMHKDYNPVSEEVNLIKGKINLTDTINNNSLIKKKVVCDFDEFDENCLLNQIINTTIFYLIKSNKIGENTKALLKRLSLYFDRVDIINIKSIKWDQVKFNRNNVSYKFVVDICKLILEGLIVTDKNGRNKFKEFLDDNRISAIYENFIKAYYRKHYPEFHAISKKLNLTDNPKDIYIPIMKTDVTLEYDNRLLIIDAKFYSKILHDGVFDARCKTVSSGNVYQILAYVDNQDPLKENKVAGMLLYAQTVDEPVITISRIMNKHNIMIRTLDMNGSWENITNTLDNIAVEFKNGFIN